MSASLHKEAGFTLVEVLISLFIFALISVGTMTALTHPYVLTTDGEALLSFTRRGKLNPSGLEARGDLERVEYHFENGAFIRRSFAHENPAQSAKTFDRVLLDDLLEAKLYAVTYQFNNLNRRFAASTERE